MASGLRLQFRTFSEAAKPIAALMNDVDAQASAALRNGAVRAKHVAVRSASLVLLSGFLESFLRQGAEAFFLELSNKGLKYSQLPAEMHKVHFVQGLDWMAKRVARKGEIDSGFADTITALARVSEPPSKNLAALLWEAFAVTKGNPGPEVIAEYMRNFGVADGLRKIAVAGNIDPTFLRASLTSFIKLRNECAHTGAAKDPPLPSDVREYVDLLRRLTLGISRVLEKRVAELSSCPSSTH
ncbi:HEPN domain-containing protein [Xanthomonas sacchari]|uniref:MAE_28990/MAE_18760 family HEPN-like nuclease n=1 Tax=Xanthomonas sacchari TaxID=56458 RepID=UPI0022596BEA|nr:HEPN domain-containing protein [Xanthomonas sacchari]UYK64771.1 HEPN domain-containing protein [Xanthomonas sacchari]